MAIWDMDDNTRALVDMKYLFECSTRYLTRSLRLLYSWDIKLNARRYIFHIYVLFSVYLQKIPEDCLKIV